MTDCTLRYNIYFSSIHLTTWIEHYNVFIKMLLDLERVSKTYMIFKNWVGIVIFSVSYENKTVLIIWGNNLRFRVRFVSNLMVFGK